LAYYLFHFPIYIFDFKYDRVVLFFEDRIFFGNQSLPALVSDVARGFAAPVPIAVNLIMCRGTCPVRPVALV
jgi:hypothetical protein